VVAPDIIKNMISLGLTFIASLFTARLVIAFKIIDMPNARSSHCTPIPRSGGIAIVIGSIVGLATTGLNTLMLYGKILPWRVLGIAMLGIAVLGLMDDLKSLKATTRFGWQFILGAMAVGCGDLALKTLPLSDYDAPLSLGVAGSILAVLWLVAYTNAFNFMDGLNGMSGGTTVISALFISIMAWQGGEVLLCKAAILLAIATMGFLIYNFPRAKLFLGDVGSYFIGFALAGYGLIAYKGHGTQISPWLFLILYFAYLFDTGFTILRRLRRGENIFSSHRGHLYQLLQQTGWSHTQVSLLYWGFACLQGIVALHLQYHSPSMQFIALGTFMLGGSLYAALIVKRAHAWGVLS
jgi:UDP-GlcNAc:undecaprenyl-phosphate GlcNAc-1-phosphate transferase